MDEISTLDLETFVASSVNEVFDTMLSMEVERSDADSQTAIEGNRIVGSVSFAGEAMGSGSDFKMKSTNWARHECFVFRHQQHIALVEVYMKSEQ